MATGARLARTSDIDDIARVQCAAWLQLSPDAVRAADLRLDPADLAASWADAILHPPSPGHRLLVAIDASTGSDLVVGYAAIGPSEDPDLPADTGEIFDLQVDPEHLRAGHGSRLMTACVDMLRQAGAPEATVWVVLDDEPRRAFWQSAGWGPDSARRTLSLGEDDLAPTITQIRLITSLQ
jgi:GNAT superfamily N-acetyltransferase